MNRGKTIIGLAAGLFSLFVFTNYAAAESRYQRWYNNGVRHELRNRQAYRDDLRELYRDRAELRRDLRNGASRSEIAQDRAEIRDDFNKLRGYRYGDNWNGYGYGDNWDGYRGYNSRYRPGWWNWWYGR